jgi:hypothetical protein
MFSEDLVLSALKAGPSWFIGDHLLRMDSGSGIPADPNGLRCERVEQNGKTGFRFWWIE